MAKRLLQAVILTILIKVLASTSSPNFSGTTSATVSQASKISMSLIYRWWDCLIEQPNSTLPNRLREQLAHRID